MIKSKYINYFECGADILAKLLITLLLQIRFACKVTAQPEIFEFKWLNVCVFLISSQAFFFFPFMRADFWVWFMQQKLFGFS